MKKRICCLLLAAVFLFGAVSLSACKRENGSGKPRIVATIFPVYDWIMNLLGEEADRAEVTLLMHNGADLHNFQPSVKDVATVSGCDLFIYVGGESDEWVEDALKEAVNREMLTVNLLELLGDDAKEEELVEGMQEEEEHEHKGEEEEEPELDEHVWLSLKNASRFVQEIAAKLGELDPDRAANYRKNAETYAEKLSALDRRYAETVQNAARKTLLFGDRFPFRYLTDDYGLNYYAAFVGCSAETEASFATIATLAKKADELNLRVILELESANGSIAQTIRENTVSKDQTILKMDSLQSSTLADHEAGITYLSVMEQNLAVLAQALQ